jgi:hypothetical protein
MKLREIENGFPVQTRSKMSSKWPILVGNGSHLDNLDNLNRMSWVLIFQRERKSDYYREFIDQVIWSDKIIDI